MPELAELEVFKRYVGSTSLHQDIDMIEVIVVNLPIASLETMLNDSGTLGTSVLATRAVAPPPSPLPPPHTSDADRPPPRVTVGDVFESKIAPLIFRFLPQRIRLWGLKRHYGI